MLSWLNRLTIWLMVGVVYLAVSGTPGRTEPLNLSPQQRQQLRALGDDIKKQTNSVRQKLGIERRELYRMYGSYRLDERRVKAQINKVNDLQESLLEVGLDDQLRLRKIVSAEQFSALKQIQKDKLRKHKEAGWGKGPRGENDRYKAIDRALDQADVTPAQRNKLRELYSEASPKRARIMGQINDATSDLERLYSRYQLNAGEARGVIKRLNRAQLDLLMFGLEQQKAIRGILSSEQFSAVHNRLKAQFHRGHRDDK